ncbi:MAG TPA: 30S ribosomal protein S12 methylthiotransferase RimO [Bacteroidota bacterium]|nr:30S ribosomal protein S12 methylthiotransferase RimO [Bacteroidota bacterium]
MRVGKTRKVHVITMGCVKNTVDSEKLMGQLRLSGIEIVPEIGDADIAVVNTCGFIDAAKEESIDMIVRQVKHKGKGPLRKVYAMGCLTERYGRDIATGIPELDGVFGSHQLPDVLRALGAEYRAELLGERLLSTPSHFAYLKVSEGCDNPCSFCAIPLMRGKHVSRSEEEILREAESLAAGGVRELIVIGQDTTAYGLDMYGERRIARLIRLLADIPGIAWVRLMYAYPAHFPEDLADVLASAPRVCRYLDIPVQHVAEGVLKSMRRGISRRALVELLGRLRGAGIALRTTLIVGYPGETEDDFAALEEFVRETRFARLGVFTYSHEEGTAAHALGDPVPPEEKDRRKSVIMEAQREISEARNLSLVGSRVRVLIDRVEEGLGIGRTEHDAPEIDNEVYVTAPGPLMPGTFSDVEIHDATEYDLYGRV